MTADELHAIRSRIDALSDLNRHQEIIELAQRGLALAPEDAWLLGQLSLAQMTSDARAARENAGRAVAAAPEDPWVHRVASVVLLETGKAREARRHAERAVALDPHDANGHLVLAHACDACGQPTKAAAAVDEVIRLAPASPAGFIERSRLCLRLRDWSTAERWARKALELDPGNSAALNNLAVARQQQGQHSEALDLFARAAIAEPGDRVAAENARESAARLGGVALGGLGCYVVIRIVTLSFRGDPAVGLGVLAVLGVALLIANRVRFDRHVAELPPHLQAYAREQRRMRWRKPPAWFGETRRQRVTRAAVVVAIAAVIAFELTESDDEPERSTPPSIELNPGVLRCTSPDQRPEECEPMPRAPSAVDPRGGVDVLLTS